MCGIVGFYGQQHIVYDIITGLSALQHRGQDAAGVVTFEKTFHLKKGLGLVSNVFEQKHLDRLVGNMGIGHVRYTTHGTNELVNAQPIAASYPFGIAMAHNGNVTNFAEMDRVLYQEYHTLPTTTNDLEIILYTFASELKTKDLAHLSSDAIFEAVHATQARVQGAYSVIAVIANHGLLAFCDPNGIRPLVMGKRESAEGTVYGFASETVCFDHLGYEVIRDLMPGEIVFIDQQKQVHSSIGYQKEQRFCVFEYIYFAREDSTIHNRLVAGQRVKMGRMLAKKVQAMGLKPDIIIDVPTSGYFAASGLSEVLGVPHRRGLVKSNYIGRSFISPHQGEREDMVRRKLNPIRKTISGKKIAVVDDSIVRGTTSRRLVKTLREAGAAEIYFISAAPPIVSPCYYGIDMSVSTELIAAQKSEPEICDFIEADALIYLDVKDLKEIFNFLPTCMACLTGEYPTQLSEEILKSFEADRAGVNI